eukprot:CAMPEP_0117686994 /NCGR_PEP_ID=MMETSP0804-20121206/22844_1 /TAXON_ID=1074897 /ORGANISM="Tetraselmis astigmatica, Strain CCMP880" /LENGTH=51 /DNA_ID=CAMNT_0005498919 /DNA_START=22 /DNA_END=173 /DNA_ORIENTATION=-
MEVAAAIKFNKPVVPVILDNKAWKMLTSPGGAAAAWEMNPELRDYDGHEFL